MARLQFGGRSKLPDNSRSRVRIEPDFSGVNLLDTLLDEACGCIFKEDTGTAQLHGFHEFFFVVTGREKDHFRVGSASLYAAEDGQAVYARKFQIHQHNVRFEEDGFVDCLNPINGFSDHLDGLMLPENTPQTFQNNWLSVSD